MGNQATKDKEKNHDDLIKAYKKLSEPLKKLPTNLPQYLSSISGANDPLKPLSNSRFDSFVKRSSGGPKKR
jgi:hypothetical protein